MVAAIITIFGYSYPIFGILALLFIWRAGQLRAYSALSVLVAFRSVSTIILLSCLQALERSHSGRHSSVYWTYFILYWVEAALESIISLYVILRVFELAMKPLKGLQKLGGLVFRWAAFLSFGLALAIGLRPSLHGLSLVTSVTTQFTAISSVLILGLLVFVCFAIRPLGLSYRSRPFGVSLGLGVSAAITLAQNAWAPQIALYTWANLILCAAVLVSQLIWAVYFYFPEVKPRILMLPTTSPYLVWNEISEALGDEPGYVAVAGIAPDVFSPAEMEIMFRASAMMDALGPETAEKPAAPQALSA